MKCFEILNHYSCDSSYLLAINTETQIYDSEPHAQSHLLILRPESMYIYLMYPAYS